MQYTSQSMQYIAKYAIYVIHIKNFFPTELNENKENEASIDPTSAINSSQENHGIRDRQTMDCDDYEFENEASAMAEVMKHKGWN